MPRKGEGTTFTVDRKLFTSDLWHASPWKLKIWIYLVGNANHADGDFMGIEIKRGQILRSLRTIRNECAYKVGYRIKKPSLDTVRRICEDFTKELRTEQRTVQAGTLITIINYNKLQPKKKGEPNGQSYAEPYSSRTGVVHNNNDSNKNNNKNNNVKKKNIYSADSSEYRLAMMIKGNIENIFPNSQSLKPGKIDAALQAWSDSIRLLQKAFGDPWEQVERVLQYAIDAPANGTFQWRTIIRSGANFRKHYEQLSIQASKKKQHSEGSNNPELLEYIKELESGGA